MSSTPTATADTHEPELSPPNAAYTSTKQYIPIYQTQSFIYILLSFLADLSRNKLVEVPTECTNYYSLERLLLYHNIIKSIPDNISSLQSLVYLDISRNQLSYLPSSVCLLQHLQCLVAHNNRLVSLPEEVGEMNKLMELDVSCNEIAHLPVQIGDLANLRSLHLRRNHLQEVTYSN